MKKKNFLTCFLILGLLVIGVYKPVQALEDSKDVTVSFSKGNTIQLTLSSDTVDFGQVAGITSTEKTGGLIATVSSSLPYSLYVQATDDFKEKSDNLKTIPKNLLQIKCSGNYIDLDGTKQTLLAGAPQGIDVSHNIDFKLKETTGYTKGNYSIPLTITATQD